jgi:hypothetical protein
MKSGLHYPETRDRTSILSSIYWIACETLCEVDAPRFFSGLLDEGTYGDGERMRTPAESRRGTCSPDVAHIMYVRFGHIPVDAAAAPSRLSSINTARRSLVLDVQSLPLPFVHSSLPVLGSQQSSTLVFLGV